MAGRLPVSPIVAARARRLGVDLDQVKGRAAGGRILMADVEAFAAARGPRASPAAALNATSRLAPSAPTAVRMGPSRFDPHREVQLDPLARNPLVDDHRQVNPAVFNLASRTAPPPTLFASGDLPPIPKALLGLPWQVRHAAAEADAREWARARSPAR